MKEAFPNLVCGFILLAVLATANCYQMFQDRIPNGAFVPHPCRPNELWKGVGHKNRGGGGDRNPFGIAFNANGRVWDRTLCMLDSDGDGKTNGQELGDPNCRWTPGNAADFTQNLSHPGICDPFDNPLCSGKPEFVSCESDVLQCDALKESETFNFTVRLPSTIVPSNETTYICVDVELPTDGDYHLVATTPLIDNANVMHHILLYGCGDDVPMTRPVNEAYVCGMTQCADIIGGWSVGSNGECSHQNSGFRIGSQGYKRATLELHWNNPLFVEGGSDSSGLLLYLTSRRRAYDAGVLTIGQINLHLPPGQQRYETSGSCSPECTRLRVRERIYITRAFNHMHYLGIQQITEVYRNGVMVQALAADETFSYDSPVFYVFETPFELLPGDELRTKCVFKTTSKETITNYGEATSDEMCFSFLDYYPKENFGGNFCAAWEGISQCDWEDQVVHGCNFRELGSSKVFENVTKNCSPHGRCLPSCKPLVKQVKSHPCFQGDVTYFLRTQGSREGTVESKYQNLMFYAALDSCDTEILLDSVGTGTTSIATLPVPLPATILVIAAALKHFLY